MQNKIAQTFTKLTGVKIRNFDSFDEYHLNDLFIINDAYIVRKTSIKDVPFINYRNEQMIYELLKDTNLTEKLVLYINTNGYKISKVIHNTFLTNSKLENYQIQTLAKQLKKLHNQPCPVAKSFEYKNNLNLLKTFVPDSSFLLVELYEKEIVEKCEEILSNTKNTFSHNMLKKNEILFTINDCKFLDWQFSSYNSELYDIAFIISQFDFNDDEKEVFLQYYFGKRYKKKLLTQLETLVNYIHIYLYYYYLFLYKKKNLIHYLEEANCYKLRLKNYKY